MLELLNTKASMIVAGAAALLVLAFGGYVLVAWAGYLGLLAIANITVLSLLSWWALAVKIARARHAPVVIRDKEGAPARVVDGQIIEHPLYPPSLTSLTYHNDPRINTKQEPVLPPVEVTPALPGPIDLLQTLQTFQPSPERILLGLAPTGPITCSLKGLSHVALAAPTGGGKSSIVRMLASQLLAVGAHMWLADPHFTPLDPESGEDWRPIAARLAQPPFTKPAHIAAVLSQLVAEMHRRYELRERGEMWNGSGYLIMEELPATLASLEKEDARQLVKDYSVLLREARKVGIYLIAVAQDWLADTIGTDGGEIRSNLRTAFFAGGGIGTARALLDQHIKLPEDTALGRGVVLLRNAEAQPAPVLARIPYASNEALYRLLPSPSTQAADFSLAPELPPLPMKKAAPARERKPSLVSEEEEKQILDLAAKGLSPAGIARAMKRAGAFADVVRLVLDEAGKIASGEEPQP